MVHFFVDILNTIGYNSNYDCNDKFGVEIIKKIIKKRLDKVIRIEYNLNRIKAVKQY